MHCYAIIYLPTDMTCLSLPLSEEPNFGTWRIAANIKVLVTTCACNCMPGAIDVLLAGHVMYVTLPFHFAAAQGAGHW